MFIIGNPKEPFNAAEFKYLKEYVQNGGRLLVLLGEGGEQKNNTNINFLLEQFSISVNSDCCVRTMYHKYHHPKECLVN
jgi:intraflagellar transport protein 52